MAADRLPLGLVVDAWPIMEWLQGREAAASTFESLLQAAERNEITLAMSRINQGEVIYLIRKNFPADIVARSLAGLHNLPIKLMSVSDRLIDLAVDLKSVYPISFADAFAAAQARESNVSLITGDRDFLHLQQDGILALHWLGA